MSAAGSRVRISGLLRVPLKGPQEDIGVSISWESFFGSLYNKSLTVWGPY